MKNLKKLLLALSLLTFNYNSESAYNGLIGNGKNMQGRTTFGNYYAGKDVSVEDPHGTGENSGNSTKSGTPESNNSNEGMVDMMHKLMNSGVVVIQINIGHYEQQCEILNCIRYIINNTNPSDFIHEVKSVQCLLEGMFPDPRVYYNSIKAFYNNADIYKISKEQLLRQSFDIFKFLPKSALPLYKWEYSVNDMMRKEVNVQKILLENNKTFIDYLKSNGVFISTIEMYADVLSIFEDAAYCVQSFFLPIFNNSNEGKKNFLLENAEQLKDYSQYVNDKYEANDYKRLMNLIFVHSIIDYISKQSHKQSNNNLTQEIHNFFQNIIKKSFEEQSAPMKNQSML